MSISITTNPYQGLKPIPFFPSTEPMEISITTNPYQGLKQGKDNKQIAIQYYFNYYKSLSGIETSFAVANKQRVNDFNYYKSLSGIETHNIPISPHDDMISITTNPYQGLKQHF